MPRSLKEILDKADDLAARFERHDPDPTDVKDAAALRAVRAAFQTRVDAEARLANAVSVARAEGHSWAAIGAMVSTSGEAARQRYGQPAQRREVLSPQTPAAGSQTNDRSQNHDGRWREKRSDTGAHPQKTKST